MKTSFHEFINADSRDALQRYVKDVDLIVTSPPYPMVRMWDSIFSQLDPIIDEAFQQNLYNYAWYLMHQILNQVWERCDTALIDGGFVCINIGDATRTFDDKFRMFSNHSKIIEWFSTHGYSVLPDIIWRKPTNAPNKFMGSGMYPAGAYVTYEHEYILIFRKGNKRVFSPEDKEIRQESAYFYEERNKWFSDLWEIKGTPQKLLNANRNRSGAFPFEIPYRLINMYSIKGDTVLDPFAGLGTTSLACMASNRNSISIDIDDTIYDNVVSCVDVRKLNKIIDNRLEAHQEFIASQKDLSSFCGHDLYSYVKTKQEQNMVIEHISDMIFNDSGTGVKCQYYRS